MFSKLRLNMGRCAIAPHFSCSDRSDCIRGILSECALDWIGFKIADSAEYLGFKIGPGATTTQWESPGLGCSFFYNVLAGNMHILSIFGYIGQLVNADATLDTFLQYMVAKMFPGPGNWISVEFLSCLSMRGYPVGLQRLQDSLCASKTRG